MRAARQVPRLLPPATPCHARAVEEGGDAGSEPTQEEQKRRTDSGDAGDGDPPAAAGRSSNSGSACVTVKVFEQRQTLQYTKQADGVFK